MFRERLLEEEATIIGDFLVELASDELLSSSLFMNIEPLMGLKSETLLGNFTSLQSKLPVPSPSWQTEVDEVGVKNAENFFLIIKGLQ